MIRLKLSNKSANEGVVLDLPATPAEVSEAFSWFERIGVEPSAVRIAGVNSPVPNLGQYILRADIHDPEQMKMLNELADSIGQMDDRKWDIFAGALDAESINGLDDVLNLSKRLGDYIILPNVRTDTELGRILVDTGYKGNTAQIAYRESHSKLICRAASIIPSVRQAGRINSGCQAGPVSQDQVRQSEQHIQFSGLLPQAPVPCLSVSEPTLDDRKYVFHFSANG